MNGLDFLDLQQQGNCLLKIDCKVIISASWSAADLAKAEELGIKAFHKPYQFDQIGAWLDQQEKLIAADRILSDIDEVLESESHRIKCCPDGEV